VYEIADVRTKRLEDQASRGVDRPFQIFLSKRSSSSQSCLPSTIHRLTYRRTCRTASLWCLPCSRAHGCCRGRCDAVDRVIHQMEAIELIEYVDAQNLAGKPAPDTFLAGAKLLGTEPSRSVVIEDAIAGVEAGSRGKFGLVIGVARKGNTEELALHGAHLVVNDLGELAD